MILTRTGHVVLEFSFQWLIQLFYQLMPTTLIVPTSCDLSNKNVFGTIYVLTKFTQFLNKYMNHSLIRSSSKAIFSFNSMLQQHQQYLCQKCHVLKSQKCHRYERQFGLFFLFMLNQHITTITATVISNNSIMTVTGSTTAIIIL